MNELKKGFFDPKTAFFSLPIVKWTLRIGITLIIGVCLLITLFSSREFDPRAEGFNEVLEMMKFPIFLLGFFAALLALFATNHRSEQNKAAMEIATLQNRFANYYKHREEFIKHCQHIEGSYDDKSLVRISKTNIYENLYKNSKNGDFNPSTEFIQRFIEIIEIIIERIRSHREVAMSSDSNEDTDRLRNEESQTAVCFKINADRFDNFISVDSENLPETAYSQENNILNIKPYPLLNLNIIYMKSQIMGLIFDFDPISSKRFKSITNHLLGHIQSLSYDSPLSQIEISKKHH